MAFAIRWHCQRGTRTADNRDHAGIGIRGESILAIVLDGSTSGAASGLFAREIARRVVDWFVTTPVEVTAATMTEQLRMTHAALAGDFKKDSASYVLLYADAARPAIVLHAGDCLLGRRDTDGSISWFLRPHTLANALMAIPHGVPANTPNAPFTCTVACNKYLIATQGNIADIRARPANVIAAIQKSGATFDSGAAVRLSNGKASPGDMEDLLSSAVEANALPQDPRALQRWADANLGVDCTGFVVAFLVEIGVLGWNATLNGGLSCPYIYTNIAKLNWA
jgi:hypothetical protein